jgi:hypothetical protein
LFVIVSASLFLTAATADLDLHLLCSGGTSVQVPESVTSAQASDSWGNRASGSSVTSRPDFVSFDVQFHLVGGVARMVVPPFVLPPVNSAKGGVLAVKNLSVGDTHISGKVNFNFLNSTSFTIDRTTGVMTTSNGFQGECNPMSATRRF